MRSFRFQLRKLIDGKDARRLVELAAGELPVERSISVIIRHILAISDFRFLKSAKTARIRMSGGRFLIEFNPEFLLRYIRTPQDLLHLIMHELMHKVHGDLLRPWFRRLRYEHQRFVANLALDMLVNCAVSSLVPDAPYLMKLYSKSKLGMLLIPPRMLGLFPRIHRGEAIMALRRKLGPLSGIYESVWIDGSVSANTLYMILMMHVGQKHPHLLFLGDHESELPEKVRGLLQRFAKLPGFGEEIVVEYTSPLSASSLRLYEALRLALEQDSMRPRTAEALSTQRGVVPNPGRRELLMLSCGYIPPFYPDPMRTVCEVEQRAHLYVDLSGSMRDLWGFAYGLVLHCREHIGEPVYGFSNKVVELKLEDVRRGKVETTGGTDFNCIVNHAIEHRFRKLVILTDGYANIWEKEKEEILKRDIEIYLILTKDGSERCPLIPIARRWWKIEDAICDR